MLLILAYIVVGGVGLGIAHFLSRAPELRPLRLSQIILVPVSMILLFALLVQYMKGTGDPIEIFVKYLAITGFTALLVGPNIAFYCGQSLSNFLDPQDWVPLEAEIELRSVMWMVEKEQYQEALEELDQLLKTHKPTYEALLLKSKLLHHFGSVDETMSVLFQMIGLCQDVKQHAAVMEAIHLLEKQYHAPRRMLVGVQEIRIYSELMLFRTETNDRSVHRIIPAGSYGVEGFFQDDCQWFKLVGEDWGNAAICWEAVDTKQEAEASRRHILGTIAQMHRMVGDRLTWFSGVKRRLKKKNSLPLQGKDFQINPILSEITLRS